jgi:hypothetical protein
VEWGVYCENFVMIGLTTNAGDTFKNRAAIPLAPCRYGRNNNYCRCLQNRSLVLSTTILEWSPIGGSGIKKNNADHLVEPTPSFTHVEKLYFFAFSHGIASLQFLSFSPVSIVTFSVFWTAYVEIFGKKV